MSLAKAVIPAAGFGTRMLPAAKAVPKELLPVLSKPVMQYVIEECAAAGVTEVALVTSRDKPALEQHFRTGGKLEQRLAASGKSAMLAELNALIAKVRLSPVFQDEQLGLGHAVLQAREVVGGDPFLCLLGDTIFSGGRPPAVQLAEAFARLGTSVIGLEQVPAEKVERYGIVGGAMASDGTMRITSFVEKPPRDQAPSRYAIAARYVLTPAVFGCLDRTPQGKGGEIQLTDALRLLLERERVHGVVLESRRHDIGNPLDWLKTNLILAASDESLRRQIAPLVRELFAD